VILALTPIVAAAAQDPLTLEDAVRIARQSAFGVIAAQANAKGTAETIQQARSASLPRLTFDASYLRYDREIAVVFDPMSPPVVVRPIDRKSLQFNLTQPVDLFGIYRLGVDGARSLQRASDRQLDAAMNNAGAEAKSAFFQVLRAQEFVGVAEEQLSATKEHLRVSEEQYAAGKVARFDVIRFQAEVSSVEQSLIQALNGVELAKASFNFVLTRPTSTPVELVRPEGLPEVTKSMEELIQLAHETRPEVLAAEYVVEYQMKYRQARQREGLPTLNVAVNFTRDPDASGFGATKDTASAAAFFSFPIFEGGLTRARVGHARQEEAKAENALNQINLAVEVDVRQAYLNVVASRKIIESAEKNVDVAREALRLANLRYREGIGTPVEVSDATALYTRARSAHVSAVYDYWNAVADLQRAVGSEDV
jgi:outer membrane protein TolC